MLQRNNVLVVDDSATMRKKIGLAVASLGYNVLYADGGNSALQMSSTHAVDVILLDIMMPEMDGFEVLERLKEDPHTRGIPVIVISGVEDRMSSIVRAIELGAEDFRHERSRTDCAAAKTHASGCSV